MMVSQMRTYIIPSMITDSETHQAHEDTEELDHICVCHRVESSNKCVEDGNQG